MNTCPKISIITVSYNSSSTIEQTILSVINQQYPNIEYIIIDGGSTDGTVDIIKKYANNITYWISERDNGIYDAMNKGIDKATGDIVGIINSDDWYSDNIFTLIASQYKLNPSAMIHGNLILEGENKTWLAYPKMNTKEYYKGTPFCHPTMFVPLKIYREIGKFNTQFRIAADYDLMLRIVENNYACNYINTTISHMRTGGESDINLIKGYQESRQITINHGYNKLKAFWAYYNKAYNIFRILLRIKNYFNK